MGNTAPEATDNIHTRAGIMLVDVCSVKFLFPAVEKLKF